MTELIVRRLLIDLQPPFQRNWCGGDAFATAFFNALSMSFPYGEQFFIDAVRNALQEADAEVREKHLTEVRGFIGQEATHRRIHTLFNAHLEKQGLQDRWTPRAQRRMELLAGADARHAVAITAATEHFTAMFADWLLSHPRVLENVEPRLQTMWMWHSAEELEHKNTAFDVYQALGGSHEWRVRWLRRTTTLFLGDLFRQTVDNLRHEGALWKLSTWRSACRLLLGHEGLLRTSWSTWWRYLRRDFHPSQQDSSLSRQWLAANRSQYVPVEAPAGAALSSA